MMGLSNAQRIYREKVATAKKRKEAALAVKRTSPSKYEKLFCKYCKSDDHLVGAFNKARKSFVETCPVLLKNKAKKKNVKDEEKKKSALWQTQMSAGVSLEHGGDWVTRGNHVPKVQVGANNSRQASISKNPFEVDGGFGEDEEDGPHEAELARTREAAGAAATVWENLSRHTIDLTGPVRTEIPYNNTPTLRYSSEKGCGGCEDWSCDTCSGASSVVSHSTLGEPRFT
jgi:hypothetical protein